MNFVRIRVNPPFNKHRQTRQLHSKTQILMGFFNLRLTCIVRADIYHVCEATLRVLTDSRKKRAKNISAVIWPASGADDNNLATSERLQLL